MGFGIWVLGFPAGCFARDLVKPAPHPDQLRFSEMSYEVPEAASVRSVLKSGPAVYLAEDHELPTI